MAQPTTVQASSWRDQFPVHPCADVFPMMSESEIVELANDIKAHGLKSPIICQYVDGRPYVLDGRNRMEALWRLGMDPKPYMTTLTAAVDSAAFVISLNIRRRHLTKEQQADRLLAVIEAAQKHAGCVENDRAKPARSFSPTKGTRGGSTPDPVLKQAVDEGKKYNISKRTIQTARAKRNGTTAAPKGPRISHAARVKRDLKDAQARHQQAVRRFDTASNTTFDAASGLVYAEARMKLLAKREGNAVQRLARELIDVGYKALAHKLHPDKGGANDQMVWLTAARDHLKQGV